MRLFLCKKVKEVGLHDLLEEEEGDKPRMTPRRKEEGYGWHESEDIYFLRGKGNPDLWNKPLIDDRMKVKLTTLEFSGYAFV
ncbi:hypothetical protein CR513_08784, partial [Mucuna pruriens]